MTAAVKNFKPASEKQLGLIKRLAGEKVVPVGGTNSAEAVCYERFLDVMGDKPIAGAEASQVIDWMFTLPRKPQEKVAGLSEGIYLAPNGDVIKVQAARGSGNLYCKVAVHKGTIERLNLHGEVVNFEYVYAPGLIKWIRPEMRMTAEMAEEYSLKFNSCMWCGRPLKAAKSVAKGMGPTCAKKFA
jgi:hypothetical protein